MPFDEEEERPSAQSQKIGINKVSSQKSMFEAMPKKPAPEEFQQKVQQVVDRDSSFKTRAAQLVTDFQRAMADKTLPQNKNMFQKELEVELLKNMVRLAQEINDSEEERQGEGTLSWVTILLKYSFSQRDRVNVLEYRLATIEKKLEGLDAQKKSE